MSSGLAADHAVDRHVVADAGEVALDAGRGVGVEQVELSAERVAVADAAGGRQEVRVSVERGDTALDVVGLHPIVVGEIITSSLRAVRSSVLKFAVSPTLCGWRSQRTRSSAAASARQTSGVSSPDALSEMTISRSR